MSLIHNSSHICLMARRIGFTALLFSSLAAPVSAQTAADLEAAVNAAAPGDVITVTPGSYDLVELGPNNFSPAVTLRFIDGASIGRMFLRDVTGLVFENLIVEAGESLNPVSENAVLVQDGGDITFRKSSFAWAKDDDPLNDGTALAFDRVDGIRVQNSHFSHVREGLIIRNSSNAEVVASHFTDMLEDAIVIAGSQHVTLRENTCTDFRRAAGLNTHPDCIQLQASSQAVADTDVLIADNAVLKGDGEKAQGIFISSRFIGEPHRDITVENNLIRQSAVLGIYAKNAENITIRNNSVYSAFEAENDPRILVRDPSTAVVIEDNVSWRVVGPAHATMNNNIAPD